MVTIRKSYLVLALLLFFIEVLIALFLHDKIIRPYGGDFLVVILLYCFVKAFFNISVFYAAFSVLLFSYLVEFSQYFHLVELLRLQQSKLAKTIIGHSFGWIDLLAYTLGIFVVLIVENKLRRVKP
jgi:hypothetical protein